jgi:hypothetical protein
MHHDGPSSSRVDKCEHFLCNTGIIADIRRFGEPASKVSGVAMLCRHDADGELGGSGIVWAVELRERSIADSQTQSIGHADTTTAGGDGEASQAQNRRVDVLRN